MKFATTLLLSTVSLFAVTSVACGSSSSSSGGGGTNRVQTISGLKGDSTAGKPLYTQNCVSCHGTDAKSGSAAKNLPGESVSEAFDQILNGGGGMQSFANLTDQEIANIWAHVVTLK